MDGFDIYVEETGEPLVDDNIDGAIAMFELAIKYAREKGIPLYLVIQPSEEKDD